MAKVILICGKICSGKTYYAQTLLQTGNIVRLSNDELMAALFHPRENDFHEMVIHKMHAYFIKKTIEIAKCGTDVLLDWGFWSKESRDNATKIFTDNGLQVEWHYIDIDDKKWERNIESRNKAVLEGKTTDYYVDEGLKKKLLSFFEEPSRDEIDIWYKA